MLDDLPDTEPTLALRCSFAADERGDSPVGTAAPAAGFLLIEQPGAWGRQALTESRLDPVVGAALGVRASAASLRVLLIRRPGRNAAPQRRAWGLARSIAGQEWMTWGTFGADEELLELPLDGSAGERSPDPAYLVCTHGRHDACCALRGRPVAAAFARERPAAAWECSHVGGDRFAANVVVLPHGLYYGRVTADAAAAVVGAQERSEVVVELLRGRTIASPAAQAAQHFARVHLGSVAIDDLEVLEESLAADGTVIVRMAHGVGEATAAVRPGRGEELGLLTCSASHPVHPPAFTLERIDVAAR